MKSALCITLLCLGSVAQAQIILGPQPSAPAAPKPDVKMIEPSPKIAPETAQPEPLVAPEAKKPKAAAAKSAKADQATVIDADETHFEPKTGVHTFIGNVKVTSPTFTLTTDGQLEVRMKQAEKKTKPKAPPTPPADAAKGSDAKGGPAPVATEEPEAEEEDVGSQIDTATATGKLSTVRQVGPDGKVKEGNARVIIYNSIKGTLTLKEWPQVQSGKSRIIATEGSTIMILDKDNHLDVKGAATTKLEPEKDPNKKPKQ